MNKYVLCYAKSDDKNGCVLLIEKNKPAWQKGLLNLPGGKIEEGESVIEAAVRELKEETGLHCNSSDVNVLGTIEGWDYCVFVCCCNCLYSDENYPLNICDEGRIISLWIEEALKNERLIDNLRYIIPLCEHEVYGWCLWDFGNKSYKLTTKKIVSLA